MKTKLLKHIFMKIKDNYKRFLSLICMAFLGVGFYVGIQSSSPDMLKTLDNFYDENNVYDISVISNVGLTEDDLLKLSKIKNVELAINIQEKDTYLEIEENNYVVKLIEYNSQMNNVYIKEGRLPKNNNEVSVDNALLENNNLKLGDNITIDGKKYSIVGNVISPLYFSAERPNSNLGSGKVDYYIYVYNGSLDLEAYSNIYITVKGAKKYLTNSDSYKKLINNVKKDIDLIKDKQQDIRYDELYSDIIETSEMYGISIDESKFIKPKWYIYDRLDNTSYKELINASDNLKKIGNIFPIIFFAISVLVSLISMMRMIEEDRVENGTLKSLGYNSFHITLKYVIYSLLATTIGSSVGAIFGSYMIPNVIWNIYKKIFFIPKFIYLLKSDYNALGLWICILCICGTSIIVCIKNLREVPANLMRPKAPKSGKKILLERINFIWKKLKFSDKITIRNIFRYKSRVITTILGIAGCTALILAGFGLKDSIKDVIDFQFNNIIKYDKMLMTNESINQIDIEKELLNDDKVENYTNVNTQNIKVLFNDEQHEVTMITPDDFKSISKSISLIDLKTNNIIDNISDNSCIISEKTAKLLDIDVGDKISLLDNDNNKYDIKVSYIIKNYINQYLYINKNTYNNLFNNYKINSILISLKEEDKNSKEFDKKYISNGYALTIVDIDDIKSSMSDMLSSIDSIVAILIIAAASLAFVVLYNLSNINISERKREIATLKVLGFYQSEVDKYINRETVLLTILGIGIGLLFGSYLSHFIISTCEPDFIMFDRHVYTLSYFYSLFITVIFTIIVTIVTHFNLKKINMVTSLKNVE
ncbi:MAG: ABC transporter permease [Bacilli bacterium]|nr:ABC transporter permease [Bacilli bacterium]